MRTRPRALARTSILGLLAGGLASAAYQALSEARDRRRFPPPGELVDIDGRRLHLWRAGEGSPAVVIATSLGEPAYGWAELQRRLAQHTTVVVYDRAGLGWRSEEHTSELQSRVDLVCRLLLEKKKKIRR